MWRILTTGGFFSKLLMLCARLLQPSCAATRRGSLALCVLTIGLCGCVPQGQAPARWTLQPAPSDGRPTTSAAEAPSQGEARALRLELRLDETLQQVPYYPQRIAQRVAEVSRWWAAHFGQPVHIAHIGTFSTAGQAETEALLDILEATPPAPGSDLVVGLTAHQLTRRMTRDDLSKARYAGAHVLLRTLTPHYERAAQHQHVAESALLIYALARHFGALPSCGPALMSPTPALPTTLADLTLDATNRAIIAAHLAAPGTAEGGLVSPRAAEDSLQISARAPALRCHREPLTQRRALWQQIQESAAALAEQGAEGAPAEGGIAQAAAPGGSSAGSPPEASGSVAAQGAQGEVLGGSSAGSPQEASGSAAAQGAQGEILGGSSAGSPQQASGSAAAQGEADAHALWTQESAEAVAQADRLLAQGSARAAFEICAPLAEQAPEGPASRCAGLAAVQLKRTPLAVRYLRAHLAHHAPTAEVTLSLAREIGRAGDDAAARALLERYLRIDPTHVRARINLGIAYARLGEIDAARGAWREALRQDPTSEDAEALLRSLPEPEAAPAEE